MPLCNAAKPNNGDVEKIMSSYYREPLMIVMDMTRAPAKLAMRRNGAEKLMRGESDWCGG